MKLWLSILIAVLLLALPVMSGCAGGLRISADGAIAIVRQYEINRLGIEELPGREALPGDWDATYEGEGHWQVTLTRELDTYSYRHSWDYFESSGVIDYKGVQYY